MDSTFVPDSKGIQTTAVDDPCTFTDSCTTMLRSVQDSIDILEGRWKIQIIVSLLYGTKRFKEISKEIRGITDKMLSKELKELEMNKLVRRTVYETFPPKVEYSITEHGKSLKTVIASLGAWGAIHRKMIIGKE